MQGLHVIGLCKFDGSLRFENKLASYLKEKVNVKKARFEILLEFSSLQELEWECLKWLVAGKFF